MNLPSWFTKDIDIKQLGNIIESHITVDGRLFVTLEENSKSLKVWTNSYFEEDIKRKMESELGEGNLTNEDFL